jgi:hypothetical protein
MDFLIVRDLSLIVMAVKKKREITFYFSLSSYSKIDGHSHLSRTFLGSVLIITIQFLDDTPNTQIFAQMVYTHKKLHSAPVAYLRETHLETKRSNESKPKSKRAKIRYPLYLAVGEQRTITPTT